VFDRFHMKGFLHQALMHWGYAPPICVIDNTNLARWYGLGANAVMVPEMEAFARAMGLGSSAMPRAQSDRKAGEERSFLDGRNQLHSRSHLRQPGGSQRPGPGMVDRADGTAAPGQGRAHSRPGLRARTPVPDPTAPHLPAPYQLLERSVDEYGYVAVDANYYELPGTGRGQVQVLRYLQHLVLCQDRRAVIEYALCPGA
jgi:hypothetical protein